MAMKEAPISGLINEAGTISDLAERIQILVDELKILKQDKDKLIEDIKKITAEHAAHKIGDEKYKLLIKERLGEQPQKYWIDYYTNSIKQLLEQIGACNSQIYLRIIGLGTKVKGPAGFLAKKELQKQIRELKINRQEIKEFIKSKKKSEPELKKVAYAVYEQNKLGKIANLFFEEFAIKLSRKHPTAFNKLYTSLKIANIKVLSKTYVSLVLLASAFTFIFSFLVLFLLSYRLPIWLAISRSLIISFFIAFVVGALVYVYPLSVIGARRRKISNELPFLTLHMAAIAGSGTPPTTIFKLVIESGEYPELSGEIKKIMNYINLFGYNLSTALRATAMTTPSPAFKELLNGMVASVETGGDLKTYLSEKAKDTFTTYKLARKKFIETLSAYSDIYTGILIATPLLFIVTLAIINSIGGSIGGFTVNQLATFGVYILIPFLNIAFILFLDIVQPEA